MIVQKLEATAPELLSKLSWSWNDRTKCLSFKLTADCRHKSLTEIMINPYPTNVENRVSS